MTPFQYENQVKFLMNGSLLLCHKQSLNVEILQNTRPKNILTFGSSHQKEKAYVHFLKVQKHSPNFGQNKAHVSPSLMQVFNFMKKYQD